MDKHNPYVINILTTNQLLDLWLIENKQLYCYRGYKVDTGWQYGRNTPQCCFCNNKSTFFLLEGWHSHYCKIKHPQCRGLLSGRESCSCLSCFNYLKQTHAQSKQFIVTILYNHFNQYIVLDIIHLIAQLFDRVRFYDCVSIFMNC